MLKPVSRNRSRMVTNILAVWNDATPLDESYGRRWYKTAHTQAQVVADRYGLSVSDVATVISILSPMNKWERNIGEAEALICVYLFGEPIESVQVSTYGTNKRKAWAFLSGLLDTPFGPRAPKTKAFAALISDPSAPEVVIDGHATCIALGEKRALADAPKLTPKRYETVASAYRLAAEIAGVAPHQMQAVTWVTWR